MTIPRALALKQINGSIWLSSEPAKEFENTEMKAVVNIPVVKKDILGLKKALPAQYVVKLGLLNINDYTIILSNDAGGKLAIGYDKTTNRYFIDRSGSGKVDFNPEFAKTFYAPRFSPSTSSDLKLVVDAASVELFADNGLSVMTCIFFPEKPLDHMQFQKNKNTVIKNLEVLPLKSVWP
jgi:fructan beta-fructosidase